MKTMIQAINMVTAALGNIIIMLTAKANMFDQVKYLCLSILGCKLGHFTTLKMLVA